MLWHGYPFCSSPERRIPAIPVSLQNCVRHSNAEVHGTAHHTTGDCITQKSETVELETLIVALNW